MDFCRQGMPGCKVFGFRVYTICRDVKLFTAMSRPREQLEWKEDKTPQLIRAFENSEGAT